MRFRTFVGILVALVLIVAVSYLSNLNTDLLVGRFAVSADRSLPLYGVLVLVFLAGFLPAVSVLLARTLRQDLAHRRERQLRREAKSLDGSFRRAIDYQADGQWARAAAEFETLLPERGEDFDILLRYGEVLRRQGFSDEALEIHRKGSVLYPQSVALLLQMAEDYAVRGEPEVAQQIRDRILREFPEVSLQLVRRGRNQALGRRQWAEASQLQIKLEGMLESIGDEAGLARERGVGRGLAYQRGVSLLSGDRFDDALRTFSSILESEPNFLPALIMRGEALLLAEGAEEAVDEWRRGFELTGSPVFLQRIEDHFIEDGQPQEVIRILHQLMAKVDDDLLPRFFLGRLYYRLEMHDEALRALGELEERLESSPTYHFLLGRVRERRGEVGKAVEAYQACLRLSGAGSAEYCCKICRTQFESWQDRCEVCGSWNSVELDLRAETVLADDLGVKSAPVWVVDGSLDDLS